MPIPQRGNTLSADLVSLSAGEDFLFDFGRIYFVCEKKMERTLRILQDFVFSAQRHCVSPACTQICFKSRCPEYRWNALG